MSEAVGEAIRGVMVYPLTGEASDERIEQLLNMIALSLAVAAGEHSKGRPGKRDEAIGRAYNKMLDLASMTCRSTQTARDAKGLKRLFEEAKTNEEAAVVRERYDGDADIIKIDGTFFVSELAKRLVW